MRKRTQLGSMLSATGAIALSLLAAAGSISCQGLIGDESGEDGATGGPKPPGPPAEYEAATAVFPRLTEAQYRKSVAQLLGGDLPVLALEQDTNPYLFYSVGATTTTVSELGVQQYEESAEAITSYLFQEPGRRVALVGCETLTPGDTCAQNFIASFGRRAFRRPLSSSELAKWNGVAATISAQPWESLRLATSGILQSPNFLYRVELGEPDAENPGLRRLNGYEVASRLSFLLWDRTPDDELLDLAAAGALDTPEGIEQEAKRLLADERASDTVQAFFAQYLNLNRIDGITRDPALYPLFTDGMTWAMRKEVELIVEDIVMKQRADFRTLFSTRKTFINSELAVLYGLEAPGATEDTFVEVTLPADGPRAGILTLGAFLTVNAHQVQTSPTLRGKYIRERLLCQEVQPPPPDVVTVLPEPGPEGPLTLREQLEAHLANPQCAACHSFMDPPGFLFENFDNIGVFRMTETSGLPIDASGDLDGKPLQGAKELALEVEKRPELSSCIVRQLYRHTMGRLETDGEEPAILELDSALQEGGYDFRSLLLSFVTHESFRTVAEEGGE
jgi:hypothetical protein